MDVWLLGAAAVVLIAITLWIVWPTRPADATADGQEANDMIPQGDRFEDQYTSATADLSAGAVATTFSSSEPTTEDKPVAAPVAPAPTAARDVIDERWSSPPVVLKRPDLARSRPIPNWLVGAAAGTLITIGGAIGGAWVYARWQHKRKQPLSRLKRKLIR
jgi:hypothetical protein